MCWGGCWHWHDPGHNARQVGVNLVHLLNRAWGLEELGGNLLLTNEYHVVGYQDIECWPSVVDHLHRVLHLVETRLRQEDRCVVVIAARHGSSDDMGFAFATLGAVTMILGFAFVRTWEGDDLGEVNTARCTYERRKGTNSLMLAHLNWRCGHGGRNEASRHSLLSSTAREAEGAHGWSKRQRAAVYTRCTHESHLTHDVLKSFSLKE